MGRKIEIPKTVAPKVIGIVVLLVLMAGSIRLLTGVLLSHLRGFLEYKIALTAGVSAAFCWGIYVLMKGLKNPGIGLLIEDRGITDLSGPWSVGEVPWSDVQEIRERVNGMGQRLLVIMVKNPEEYMRRSDRGMGSSREVLHRQFGSPVVIGASALKCRYAELKAALDSAFAEYRMLHDA